MYVLVLNETQDEAQPGGYTLIEENEVEGYNVIAFPGGPVRKMKIRGRKRRIPIMPIGQIVIDAYNKKLESYLNKGGTVSECLKSHRKPGLIKLDPPYPPSWIFPKDQNKEEDLAKIDFDLPYISVCFINFQGILTPVFSVSELSDLYFYDLFRLKTGGTDIRECVDCARAFFGKTTAVRCPKCRQEGKGEQKKLENLKADPVRHQIYKIKNRISKRTPENIKGYEYEYVNELHRRLNDASDNLAGTALEKGVQELNELDKKFWKLFRSIRDEKAYLPADGIEQWDKECYSMFKNENPEHWLKDWYSRAGLN